MATPKETTAAPAAKFDPSKVKKVKAVTRPILQLPEGTTRYVKILDKIFTGKEIKGTEKKADQKPAEIANILNHENGKEMQLVVGAVVKANLEEEYPKDEYVGKSFAITKLGKKEGKRYFTYEITEITV